MLRWLSTGRLSASVIALLMLTFAVGVFDPWISEDQQNAAVNLVEELEVDAEESLHDVFLETVFYEASRVWQPVLFWPLCLSDCPRHGAHLAFLEPQSQRPPPAEVDRCI